MDILTKGRLNSIKNDFPKLTSYQLDRLQEIIELKLFSWNNMQMDDDDFVLSKKDENGLTNLILHPDYICCLSYIPYNKKEEAILEFECQINHFKDKLTKS